MLRSTPRGRCVIALCAVAYIPGGCASSPARQADVALRAPAAARLPSEFAPVRVRVHPLTRFIRAGSPDAEPRIDAHIELLDRWGLPVRALGELRLFARFGSAASDAIARTRPDFAGVIAWSIDMTDPDRNANNFYDRVTHTYRIELSDPALRLVGDEPFTLEALFIMPGAVVMLGSARISPGPLPD